MVRIPDVHCYGPGLIPGRGTEILQATQQKIFKCKKIKKKKKERMRDKS